jgi:transcriptional regulator with XRE-family HTH domain
MTDAELLRILLDKNEWTQKQLAEKLKFDRSQVSRVIHKKTALRPLTREKAEKIFQQLLEKQVQQEQAA